MVLIGEKIIKFSMSNVEDLKGIIPAGNWLVRYDEFNREYFLEKTDDFTLPSKIYGDTESLAKRYLNTFEDSKKNLGIGLTGLKGTGKSLLAKQVCIFAELPVIIITEEFSGSDFSSFLSNIKQESVVFIDEFEKVYENRDAQESFLSILDGVFMGKKLFLFTSNETSKYSNYLINRPGRIHYMKTFDRISDDMLDDILNENLQNKKHIQEFKEIIELIEEANVDMVFALISECNMYKESPRSAVKYLNIRVTNDSNYSITAVHNKTGCEYEGSMNGSPLLPVYGLQLDMKDEVWEKLTDKQQDDRVKFPYSVGIRVTTNKNNVERKEGRQVVIKHKDYLITATPRKEYSFVF